MERSTIKAILSVVKEIIMQRQSARVTGHFTAISTYDDNFYFLSPQATVRSDQRQRMPPQSNV